MPTLHLLCGKIASGKSTLANRLAAEHAAIVLSEDQWLAQLYPGEIVSIADYLCSARLHARNARGEHDFAATDLITRHCCVPIEEEGLEIVLHRLAVE